jgi:hypothetical protein
MIGPLSNMPCPYIEVTLLLYKVDAKVTDSAKNVAVSRNVSIILSIVVACMLNAVDRWVVMAQQYVACPAPGNTRCMLSARYEP